MMHKRLVSRHTKGIPHSWSSGNVGSVLLDRDSSHSARQRHIRVFGRNHPWSSAVCKEVQDGSYSQSGSLQMQASGTLHRRSTATVIGRSTLSMIFCIGG